MKAVLKKFIVIRDYIREVENVQISEHIEENSGIKRSRVTQKEQKTVNNQIEG